MSNKSSSQSIPNSSYQTPPPKNNYPTRCQKHSFQYNCLHEGTEDGPRCPAHSKGNNTCSEPPPLDIVKSWNMKPYPCPKCQAERQRPPGSDNKRKDRDDDDKPKGKDDDDEPKGPPRKVPGLFKKSKERGLGS